MYQKLLMNGFIVNHKIVRLILKELDPVGVEQRVRHNLNRRTYISTDPNQTSLVW